MEIKWLEITKIESNRLINRQQNRQQHKDTETKNPHNLLSCKGLVIIFLYEVVTRLGLEPYKMRENNRNPKPLIYIGFKGVLRPHYISQIF